MSSDVGSGGGAVGFIATVRDESCGIDENERLKSVVVSRVPLHSSPCSNPFL